MLAGSFGTHCKLAQGAPPGGKLPVGAPQYTVELATQPAQHCDQEIYCVAREG